MRRLLFLTVFLAACGDTPVEPPPVANDVTGYWAGTASGTIVEARIDAPGTGALSGCVAFGFLPAQDPQGRVLVRLVGSANGSVSLTVAPGFGVAWTFTGSKDGDQLSGRSEGEAWSNASTVLTKQPGAGPSC